MGTARSGLRLDCLEELAPQSAGFAVLDDEVGGVVECHEAAHCGGDVGDEFVFGPDARFEVQALEMQGGSAAFELGVEASD